MIVSIISTQHLKCNPFPPEMIRRLSAINFLEMRKLFPLSAMVDLSGKSALTESTEERRKTKSEIKSKYGIMSNNMPTFSLKTASVMYALHYEYHSILSQSRGDLQS